MPIRTKSVYDEAAPSDGRRLLITRYWPRGIAKATVSADWEKDLAPSRDLLAAFKHGGIAWTGFARRFKREMAAPAGQAALARLRDAVREGATVTLLCICRDPARTEDDVECHRRLVRELL